MSRLVVIAAVARNGVIGAGNMGSGIVQKIAQEGIPVVMVDLKEEFVQRGLGTIRRLLQEGVERKIFKPEQVDQILSRVTGTTDFKALADAGDNVSQAARALGISRDTLRYRIDKHGLEAVLAEIRANPALLEPPVLVFQNPKWPAGVIGIVASRLVDTYNKPVALISTENGGHGRGSIRSAPGSSKAPRT